MATSSEPELVRLEYELSQQDLLSASRYLGRHLPDYRWYRIHLLLLWVVFSVLLFDLLWRRSSGTDPILEAIGALLIAGLVVHWCWRSYHPRLTRYMPFVGRYQLEADAAGIRIQWPHGSSRYTWTAFTRFSQNHSHLFLFVSSAQAVSIPKHACEPVQLGAFVQLASEHIGSDW
jgi:ABC-type nickel/cobalt efflux system permease component RcnA